MPAGRLSILLLAAGQGRRFGGNKLLHPLPDGQPVAMAAARALAGCEARRLAVLSAAQTELARLLAAEGWETLICADAHRGMGHSLAAGVAASPDTRGWLVALADMPFIQPATHQQLLARLAAGARLVAPVHQGQRGHPVGFGAEWRPALLALQGDVGARPILQAHPEALALCPVDDGGVLRDVDVVGDVSADVPQG
jgi:molybdenum cofactor cytidylyltransferase